MLHRTPSPPVWRRILPGEGLRPCMPCPCCWARGSSRGRCGRAARRAAGCSLPCSRLSLSEAAPTHQGQVQREGEGLPRDQRVARNPPPSAFMRHRQVPPHIRLSDQQMRRLLLPDTHIHIDINVLRMACAYQEHHPNFPDI